MYKSTRELNKAFRQEFKGILNFKKIKSFSGNETMHVADTRCAFVDWLDQLHRDGLISDRLAQSATLK